MAVLPVAKASITKQVYQVSLSASAESIVADGTSTITITATITDREGRPAGAGIPVEWSTSFGALISADTSTDGLGNARATLQSGIMEGAATVRVISHNMDASIYISFTPNELYSEVPGAETYWYVIKEKSGKLAFYDIAINGKIYTSWYGPEGKAPSLDPFFPTVVPTQYTWGTFVKQAQSYSATLDVFAYTVLSKAP